MNKLKQKMDLEDKMVNYNQKFFDYKNFSNNNNNNNQNLKRQKDINDIPMPLLKAKKKIGLKKKQIIKMIIVLKE